MKERSDAWAARRVGDVLNPPGQKALERCSLSEYEQSVPDWRATVEGFVRAAPNAGFPRFGAEMVTPTGIEPVFQP